MSILIDDTTVNYNVQSYVNCQRKHDLVKDGVFTDPPTVVVVGAGVAGLAAAMTLASMGARVTLLERAATTGGKIRTVPSATGPVDAGPTVITMRHVFENLFRRTGSPLQDHVELVEEPLLARHWWPGGGSLDLFADRGRSIDAIRAFSDARSALEFERFAKESETLFKAFQRPIIEAAEPSYSAMIRHVAMRPWLAPMIGPHQTLRQRLKKRFSDPRLAQLFGRYATYVGGSPLSSPAILSLIWHTEASGVWIVKGGVTALAEAMTQQAAAMGVDIICDTDVARIAVGEVEDVSGRIWFGDAVLYAGDPAALRAGLLGDWPKGAVADDAVNQRSLSAYVWAFAATPDGPAGDEPLAHHNVFFGRNAEAEFRDLAAGRPPADPTLYICAQDRGPGQSPTSAERFEIIMNGPDAPLGARPTVEEQETCQTRTFETLTDFGLTFSPQPGRAALTTPADFGALFPGSGGSLYGLSPQGLDATFRRPTARSKLAGLYLAGGGVHPGAGAPMATLSGLRAAEAIATDLALTSRSRQTAMHGGM